MAEPSDLTLPFLRRHPPDAARVLETLPPEEATAYLQDVPVKLAAPVVAAMLPFYAALCLARLAADTATALLGRVPATSAAAVLRRMPQAPREALMASLPARTALGLRLLLRYPANTVGAWMEPAVPCLPAGILVHDAWSRLLREAETLDRFVHVVDREQALVGRIATADLLRANEAMLIDRLLMANAPPALAARTDLAHALRQPHWPESDPLPVISHERRFLGVARFATLVEAQNEPFEGQPTTVFRGTLMELMETYWMGLSRLLEGAFTPPPAAGDSSRKRR